MRAREQRERAPIDHASEATTNLESESLGNQVLVARHSIAREVVHIDLRRDGVHVEGGAREPTDQVLRRLRVRQLRHVGAELEPQLAQLLVQIGDGVDALGTHLVRKYTVSTVCKHVALARSWVPSGASRAAALASRCVAVAANRRGGAMRRARSAARAGCDRWRAGTSRRVARAHRVLLGGAR